MYNRLAIILTFCSSLVSLPAHAQSADSIWSINGYGTLGAAHSTESRADYIPNPVNPEGPGLSKDWDALLDTRAAVQLSVQPNEKLTGVVQVVAEKRYDGKFKPRVEWANLQYALTPSLQVRAGRIALGTYMTSDHRKVGYSLPWVRPPAELYHLVPITNSDGLDIAYHYNAPNSTYTAQLHYGRNKAKELDGLLEAPNVWGTVHRFERGPLTLHASYMSIKIDYGTLFSSLWSAYRGFGPAGAAVARSYDASGKWSPFMAAGMKYDTGDWFVTGEWGRGEIPSDFDTRNGWYVSGGYRLGAVTPYITYARAGGGHRTVNGLDATAYPASLTPVITTLNESLFDMQQGFGSRQQTVSVGARWDVLSSVAATMQYDMIRTREGSIGTFRNMVPGYRPREADIVSITIDFVF